MRLTTGLKSIDRSLDVQPGQSFIVHYKNNSIGNRMDLWLGIIIPESLGTPMLLARRHNKAKPLPGDDRDWNDVPVQDRAYPVYIPGKNVYQWLQRKNLFKVESSPPDIIANSTRDDLTLFLDLHKLARRNRDGAHFWFRMAAEELKVKGPLGREPFLVLPPPQQRENNTENGGSNNNGRQKSNAKSKNGGGRGSAGAGSSEGRSTATASGPAAIEVKEGRSTSHAAAGNKTVANGHSSKLSEDDLLDIYIGSGTEQAIFQLTRKAASASPLLLHHLREGQPSPFVMHPDLYQMPASTFEPVHSFLATGDYSPKLIAVDESIKAGEDDTILGDQFKFGLKYDLENINSAEELHKEIVRLGTVYISAKVFGLPTMQVLTLWKLQAAWNSYSGVAELPYFLQTVQLLFEKTRNCPDSLIRGTSKEPMQRWAAGFLADLMDFFFRAHLEQYWKLLKENPALQAAVFERRATNLAKDPAKYVDLEKQMREQGRFSVGN